jgi:hypothetical protein
MKNIIKLKLISFLSFLIFVISACGPLRTVLSNDGLTLAIDKVQGNRCTTDQGSIVLYAWQTIRDISEEMGLRKNWPPKEEILVCIVEDRPYVVCGSAVLAGCSWSNDVRVAVYWYASKTSDWRYTLVHEIIGALTLQDVLDLPLPETKMIVSENYKALTKAVNESAFN